jgi:S-formylglutathione hydrolase
MFERLSSHAMFGGVQHICTHASEVVGLPMRFSIYMPPQSRHGLVPGVFYLAGLTCTEETFAIKSGAQRFACEHGLALISPDTSPRGAGLPGEDASWDIGAGAGFYLDATVQPWAKHYQMYSYVLHELRETVLAHFPVDGESTGIFGHSMGGHGALVLALRNPSVFRSVSAFAPICAPMHCPWGIKAFETYLGPDRKAWARYDACELLRSTPHRFEEGILIDQGLADQFLVNQLNPDLIEKACQSTGQALTLRRHPGYDHGYYFVSTFVESHMAHHARCLK